MDNFDDYDFTPTSNSSLSSLFDSSPLNPSVPSLSYIAPKQPKPNVATQKPAQTQSETKTESNVICAKIVSVWKLTNNKYTSVGTHGLAVIGSSSIHLYELILYKEKTNVISRVNINSEFEITLKKDNFASFYDHLQQNWLIKFSNDEDSKTLSDNIEKLHGKIVVEASLQQSTHKQSTEVVSNSKPDEEETKAKSEILTRIAKMGQSMLSNTTPINQSTDISDSEEESSRIFDSVTSISSNESHIIPPQARSTLLNTVQLPNRQLPQNIPTTYLVGQSMSYDPLNLLFAENRTHNTEVRLNLAQISDKLNQLLKVAGDNPKNENKTDNSCEDKDLKSKVKVLELRQENVLKELRDYEEKFLQQQTLIQEMKQNTKVKEEANKVEKLENEVKNYNDQISNLFETLRIHKEELKQAKEADELSKNELKSVKEENSSLQKVSEELQVKIKNLELECDFKKTSEQNTDDFVEVLKMAMNSMYGNITSSFEDGQNYSSSQVQNVVAQNIKSATLSLIKEFQGRFKN